MLAEVIDAVCMRLAEAGIFYYPGGNIEYKPEAGRVPVTAKRLPADGRVPRPPQGGKQQQPSTSTARNCHYPAATPSRSVSRCTFVPHPQLTLSQTEQWRLCTACTPPSGEPSTWTAASTQAPHSSEPMKKASTIAQTTFN